MFLTLYTENKELADKYLEAARKHNNNFTEKEHMDSGFDMFVPKELSSKAQTLTKIDSEVVGVMTQNDYHPLDQDSNGYYVYPRSSISKTSLRLANQVGIIDAGYRGNLIGMFDNIRTEDYDVEKHQRLLQICAPDLSPFQVKVIWRDDLSELRESTKRGKGGFGSTGN